MQLLVEKLKELSVTEEGVNKEVYRQLQDEIEKLCQQLTDLRHPHSAQNCPTRPKHHSGPCSEAHVTSYVYRSIEELNKEFDQHAKKIHDKYEEQMKKWMETHLHNLEEKN